MTSHHQEDMQGLCQHVYQVESGILEKLRRVQVHLEGIFTSDKRLEEMVDQKAEPRDRSEQEIAGYWEVFATIYESYEYIMLKPNLILQLHYTDTVSHLLHDVPVFLLKNIVPGQITNNSLLQT